MILVAFGPRGGEQDILVDLAVLRVRGRGARGRAADAGGEVGAAASGLPDSSDAGRKITAGKYTIGVAGAYGLSGDLRKGFVLIAGAQYGRMLGRYADSPIVAEAGDADQWLGGVGIAYQF